MNGPANFAPGSLTADCRHRALHYWHYPMNYCCKSAPRQLTVGFVLYRQAPNCLNHWMLYCWWNCNCSGCEIVNGSMCCPVTRCLTATFSSYDDGCCYYYYCYYCCYCCCYYCYYCDDGGYGAGGGYLLAAATANDYHYLPPVSLDDGANYY